MGKQALGRGLDALISGSLESDIKQGNVQYISISKIISNPLQPRKSYDREGIDELAQSIKNNGLIQPIVVRKNGDKFEMVVGERRLRAAKIAELKEIPAIVKEYSNGKIFEIALIENIQREDLNPIEEALAYRMILDREMITQEELSKRVGKSRSYIANMVRILELPSYIQDHVSRGTISVGQAKALLSLNDRKEQDTLVKKILQENLTVREVERLTKRKPVPRGTKNFEEKLYVEELEEKLRSKLGTKISIDYRRGKGLIKIEFYSNEDLERIIGEIVNF